MHSCNLQPADGHALAAAIQQYKLPQLEVLGLVDNPSMGKNAEGAILIAALGHPGTLKIDLYGSYGCGSIDDNYAVSLDQSKVFLRDCRLPRKMKNELVSRLHRLADLSINHFNMGGQMTALLSQTCPLLKVISLEKCNLQLADCNALAAAIQQNNVPQLEELTLNDNDLGGKVAILASQTYPQLKKLSLTYCRMQPVDCTALAASLQQHRLPKIEELWLGGNDLHGQIPALTLFVQPHLRQLILWDSHLQPSDGHSLAAAIEQQKLPQLWQLNLTGNCGCYPLDKSLGDDGAAAVLHAALNHHQRKLVIKLYDCDMSKQFEKQWELKCKDTHVFPVLHAIYDLY